MSDAQFRDADPEDAWDDVDPLEVKIALLLRIVEALRALDEVPPGRRDEAFRLLVKLERLRDGIQTKLAQIRTALQEM